MSSLRCSLVAAFALGFTITVAATPQDSDSATSHSVEESLRAISAQLADLTRLLKAVLPPSPVEEVPSFELSIEGAPSRGSHTAQLVLVEFSDFECPFCGRHSETAYKDLNRAQIASGALMYVFRHLPLEQLHPNALAAAEAAECAREQGRFWEMHDEIFANQKALSRADLMKYAGAAKVDAANLDLCLKDGRAKARIAADLSEAARLNLTGTPSFFLGERVGDSVVRVRYRIVGAHPYAVFQEAITAASLNRSNALSR